MVAGVRLILSALRLFRLLARRFRKLWGLYQGMRKALTTEGTEEPGFSSVSSCSLWLRHSPLQMNLSDGLGRK
jgi:hypothetical protein